MEVCKRCGLPLPLCVCKQIAKETQKVKVRVETRTYGKIVTIVEGIREDVKATCRELKKRLKCGGSFKEGKIQLQGDHRKRIKEILKELGLKEEQIEISW